MDAILEAKRTSSNKMHSSMKGLLFDHTQSKKIADYRQTPQARNGSVSLRGGAESVSIV
jgi:hypothetical protein